MIITLKNVDHKTAHDLSIKNQGILKSSGSSFLLILSSRIKSLPTELEAYADSFKVLESDIQLASKDFQPEKREIKINGQIIGGKTNNTMVITGPCSIESWEQINQSAELLKELGISTLRAGCYKPRTSPYTFQGLGLEGLKMLDKIRSQYGFNIITEVRDASHVDEVINYADIVQIGAKAMYDHGILKKCGQTDKSILLKRGFGSTLQEFAQAAEFILSGGNDNVILCERGIRTFETKTRFTLDLCGVAYLKDKTNLPIFIDPSHAMGYRYGVADLSRAAAAMNVDGLIIETHPNPSIAKSDADQQLDHDQFKELFFSLTPITEAIGNKII